MKTMILTTPKMLANSLEKYSSLTAFQMKNKNGKYIKISYKEFFDAVMAVSSFLSDKGIKHGDKISILCENRPEWPILYFGIAQTGAVVVPLDPKLGENEILNFVSEGFKTQLRDSDPNNDTNDERNDDTGQNVNFSGRRIICFFLFRSHKSGVLRSKRT